MKFKFDISLNDKDYTDYNVFVQMRSHYGKKTMLIYRLILIAIFIFFTYTNYFGDGFTKEAIVSAVPATIIFVGIIILLSPILKLLLRMLFALHKKSGKLGYSPQSVLEFFDDCFVETVENGKSQYNYTAVERISIINDEKMYIHLNKMMAYILSASCFESKEQYQAFLDFIKIKCKNIDKY